MPLTRGHTCEYLNENLLLNSVLVMDYTLEVEGCRKQNQPWYM